MRVLDAGCGTGLAVEELREVWKNKSGHEFYFVGVDFSQEMLDVSASKHCLHELHCMDLWTDEVFTLERFDFIVATGVFMEGHCGPNELQRLLNMLMPGGTASITVRAASFCNQEKEYLTATHNATCDIIADDRLDYRSVRADAGEGLMMEANYLLQKKKEASEDIKSNE